MQPAGDLDLSVIVPVYNEAENLPALVGEISAALKPLDRKYELLLVDDGSRDESVQVAAELRTRYPEIRLIRFRENCGQSAALHAGFAQARGRTLVTLDADLQNDPADIPRLLALLRDCDMVCGWRRNRQDSWVKRAASRVANAVRSRFLGDGIRDTGCTLKAFRREVAAVLPLFRGMHRFIPAFARASGFRVIETPVGHRPRRHGDSKYTVRARAIRATCDMFGVRWLLIRDCRYEIISEEGKPWTK